MHYLLFWRLYTVSLTLLNLDNNVSKDFSKASVLFSTVVPLLMDFESTFWNKSIPTQRKIAKCMVPISPI